MDQTSSGRSQVRTIRLTRQTAQESFGFSVRGGREHGTGFFVSAVERGSEAQYQGLQIGDQIMRVNGFSVDSAVHQEILHLVQRQTHIVLKVRTVGMLPIKDNCQDPLTWRLVKIEVNEPNISCVNVNHSEYEYKDIRIYLEIADKAKLGCGVCKGPDWKPGIFVQYTMEKGVAREAGLRPGDQIIQCNGVPFLQTDFTHAVEVLKSARQLDLIIRKGAGLELFPGESSGYNSCASSVNDGCGDTKRLSVVKEEDDRVLQSDSVNRAHAPTVVHVSNFEEDRGKLAEICMISQQQETTTVIVEVHSSGRENTPFSVAHERILDNQSTQLPKSLSYHSLESESSTKSLSSALSEELHKRTKRAETDLTRDQRRKTLLKSIDKEEEERHQKLMNEFKLAHRRMFKLTEHQKEAELECDPAPMRAASEKDREVTCFISSLASPPPPPMPPDSVSTSSCNSSTPPFCPTPDYDTSSLISAETSHNKTVQSHLIYAKSNKHGTSTLTNEVTNSTLKPNSRIITLDGNNFSRKTPKIPSSELPARKREMNVNKTIAIISPDDQPSQVIKDKKVCDTDHVEMVSIESFTLNNPSSPKPKPPATYFGANSSQVSSKKPKPVAVTIGEYCTGSERMCPARFDFLSNPNSEAKLISREGKHIGSTLHKELELSLSRSNLWKQIDSQENGKRGEEMTLESHAGSALRPEVCNNRVTIRVPDSHGLETVNGILKKGMGTRLTEHRGIFQQRSISFGENTTINNDCLPSH